MASDNCLYMLNEVAIPTFSRGMLTAYYCIRRELGKDLLKHRAASEKDPSDT